MADEKEVIEHGEDEVIEGTEESTEISGETTESTETNEDLSEAQQKEAKALYKMLRDKDQQKNVIRMMAQSVGLLNTETLETKKDVREAKKDLKAIFKEKLGPEFAFISDRMSDAIESVLEEERKELNQRLSATEAKEVQNETTRALDKLNRETKGNSKQFEGKMIELMGRISPSDDLSTEEYLKMLYTIASAGKTAASTRNQIADKINRNAGNAADRLQSRGTGRGGTTTGPEKKGLKNAVRYAMQQLGIEE